MVEQHHCSLRTSTASIQPILDFSHHSLGLLQLFRHKLGLFVTLKLLLRYDVHGCWLVIFYTWSINFEIRSANLETFF